MVPWNQKPVCHQLALLTPWKLDYVDGILIPTVFLIVSEGASVKIHLAKKSSQSQMGRHEAVPQVTPQIYAIVPLNIKAFH